MSDSSQQLFQQAQQAQQRVIGAQEAGGRLPQLLREAVTQSLQDSPLAQQRGEAAQQVLTAPTRGREQIANILQQGTILSPTQQQSILAAQRAADVVPLLSLNDLLQAQTGGVETAVQGGLGAFNSLLNAQIQRANLAQQAAQNAAAREQQQFENQLALQQFASQQQRARGGGGAGGASFLQSLLDRGAAGVGADVGLDLGGSVRQGLGSGRSPFEDVDTGLDRPQRDIQQPIQESNLLRLLTPEALTTGVLSGELSASEAKLLGNLSGAIPTTAQIKVQSEERKIKQSIEDLENIEDEIDDLKPTLISRTKFEGTKRLAGQFLARLVETGRLSDEDRNFYQGSLPGFIESIIVPGVAKAKVESANNFLKSRLKETELEAAGGAVRESEDFRPD